MARLPRGIALFFAVYFLQGMVFYSPVGRIKKGRAAFAVPLPFCGHAAAWKSSSRSRRASLSLSAENKNRPVWS